MLKGTNQKFVLGCLFCFTKSCSIVLLFTPRSHCKKVSPGLIIMIHLAPFNKRCVISFDPSKQIASFVKGNVGFMYTNYLLFC